MELHRVVLEVDPALLIRSEEQQADLIREFQLISLGAAARPEAGPPLPGRLADLIVETLARYQGVQEENLTRAHQALADGRDTVVLEMDLPLEVVPAVTSILGALEEADAYCRAGQGLLTLAAPVEVARLRRWFVTEIARQLGVPDPVPSLPDRGTPVP